MDSLVCTRDSTRQALGTPYGPTTGPLGATLDTHTLEARKISKAERTPMAHRERTGSALVHAQG